VDLDPLAVLLSRVWTRTVDSDVVTRRAVAVLKRARGVFAETTSARAYPVGSDAHTRKFIRYWFDAYARRQLAALSVAIHRVQDRNVRDVLWCGFSRLIITKSAGASLAMDLSHSRPHRQFETAPVKPFSKFLAAVEAVVSNCPMKGDAPVGPRSVVKLGDARKLGIASASIDLVLTSPPYLNAIDYMRCSKFSLVWMGFTVDQIREIRGDSVGAEASSMDAVETPWVQELLKKMGMTTRLSARNSGLLARYAFDMDGALAEVTRVLKVGGRAVYVVGDSTVRGTFVRNSLVVTAVAEANGLTLESRRSRVLPANRRYMPPPQRGLSATSIEGRMRREVVLVFSKLAGGRRRKHLL
jgi:hypothetical protein